MPLPSPTGQPDSASAWFGSEAGQAVLESEQAVLLRAFAERPSQPWLWLGPVAQALDIDGRGLRLVASGKAWTGTAHCGLPLPLANESIAVVVVQHVASARSSARGLLDECARVLVPGGRLWLLALNPLAPYRWRWRGSGLGASEPLTWRRRLRAAGLAAEPVSQGLGPSWRVGVMHDLQDGPGLRAAYLIRAEKRAWPMTPVRRRTPLRLPEGVPAA